MDLTASFEKKTFVFKQPSGTSRGILTEKHAWFIYVKNKNNSNIVGIGECSIIPGLSPDFENFKQYETKVAEVVENINHFAQNSAELIEYPSIYFGLEMALRDLNTGGKRLYFDTDFSHGKKSISINGLVWMGDKTFMQKQIDEKINQGFNCIKLKIGALDFDTELEILKQIRIRYHQKEIELRLDANGAFSPNEAVQKLKKLSEFQIHSIEQPIAPKQFENMHQLCRQEIIPIALDEELIGVHLNDEKENLLSTIRPQYIILKPSLIGGFKGSEEWINTANKHNIPWWITSALESNIGLDAIAQFVSQYKTTLPQGLGTGALYTNNIDSPLAIENGEIKRKV